MDHSMIRKHLALAKRHVLRGEKVVATQTALVAKLREEGREMAPASALLRQFEDTLAIFIYDRDRLLKLLTKLE